MGEEGYSQYSHVLVCFSILFKVGLGSGQCAFAVLVNLLPYLPVYAEKLGVREFFWSPIY